MNYQLGIFVVYGLLLKVLILTHFDGTSDQIAIIVFAFP